MRSSQLKEESGNIFDKQMEVFKNLRGRKQGQRMEQTDMRVLEMTSDFNMAEDIEQPMGEVPQLLDDEDSGDDLVLPSRKHQ